jgi:hypothetical protein
MIGFLKVGLVASVLEIYGIDLALFDLGLWCAGGHSHRLEYSLRAATADFVSYDARRIYWFLFCR